MLYLFHGSDTEKVRAKAFEWVAKARAKEPNLAYVRLAREELTDATLEDAALSGGLFVQRLLVLIDDPFAHVKGFVNPSDSEDFGSQSSDDGLQKSQHILDDHLDALAASDNAILILAPKLAAAKAKKIVAKAKIAYEFNVDKSDLSKPARGFNSNLVNAFAARNREKLWLEINKALRAGDAPEMLHGLLHWKTRDLMEKGSRVWKPEESRALSLSLISLLQTSRRGGLDLALSLEKFALSL